MSHILKLDALKQAQVSTLPYPYFVLENSIVDTEVKAVIQDFPKIEQGGSYNIEDVEIKPNFDRFLKSLDTKEFRQILTDKFDVDVASQNNVLCRPGVFLLCSILLRRGC